MYDIAITEGEKQKFLNHSISALEEIDQEKNSLHQTKSEKIVFNNCTQHVRT